MSYNCIGNIILRFEFVSLKCLVHTKVSLSFCLMPAQVLSTFVRLFKVRIFLAGFRSSRDELYLAFLHFFFLSSLDAFG